MSGAVPAGAVDSQVHVIDPLRFPVPEGRGHKPQPRDAATAEDVACVLDEHAVASAVVVQLSGYGTNNDAVLDAVARSEGRWRAVIAVPTDLTEYDLDGLTARGAVGVRFNVSNLGIGVLAGAERLLAMLGERGLFAQVQCPTARLPDIAPMLAASPATLVFDHLGCPDPAKGVEDAGFQRLLAFGRSGAVVKLSGGFRLSAAPFPHRDLDPLVDAVLDAFPRDRRIWGSDFPFVAVARRPTYRETLDLLVRWLPDDEERQLALVDNPHRLFGLSR
jgi:predicted TIM-barrel fold metal-dependent hydrolase